MIYHSSSAVTVWNICPRYLCRDLINSKIYWFCIRLRPLCGGIGTLGGSLDEKEQQMFSTCTHRQLALLPALSRAPYIRLLQSQWPRPRGTSLPTRASGPVCNSPGSSEKQKKKRPHEVLNPALSQAQILAEADLQEGSTQRLLPLPEDLLF